MLDNLSDWSREFAQGTVRDSLSKIVDDATPGLIDRLASDPNAYEDLITVINLVSQEADELLRETIISARHAGLSWDRIGKLLGISRQAAQQRFSAGPPAHSADGSLAADVTMQPDLFPHGLPNHLATDPTGFGGIVPGGGGVLPTMVSSSPPIGTTTTIDEASDDNVKMLNRAGQFGWRCIGFTTWTWTLEMTGTQWVAAATMGREPAGGGWARIGRWAHMVFWTRPNSVAPIPNSPNPEVFSSPKKFQKALDKQRQLPMVAPTGTQGGSLSRSFAAIADVSLLATAIDKATDFLSD